MDFFALQLPDKIDNQGKKYLFLDPNFVENIDMYHKIKEIVLCTICLGVLVEPKTCDRCESSFCSSCIDQWSLNKKECPFRCLNSTFKEPSRILKKNLDL